VKKISHRIRDSHTTSNLNLWCHFPARFCCYRFYGFTVPCGFRR